MADLIPLSDIDSALVEALLDDAFGEGRKDRTAYKIRDGAEQLERLCFAAVDGEADILLGTIQAWPVALTDSDNKRHPMVMVGPVAVHPDVQGEGVGKALMHALLAAVPDEAPLPLMMIGDPEYYGRFFGFSAEGTSGWQVPGPCEPERLLLRKTSNVELPENGALGPWR